MPLEMVEIRELRQWVTGFGVSIIERDGTLGPPDTSLGWSPENGMGSGRDSNWVEAGYYQLADQLIYFGAAIIRDSGMGIISVEQGPIIFDSQGIDNIGGHFKDAYTIPNIKPTPNFVGKFYMGQWRLEGGAQRIYSFGNFPAVNSWLEYNAQTLDYVQSVYPNFNPQASVIAAANDGYFTASNYATNVLGRIPQGMIFFEGITDSAAYSEVTDGPSSSHPLGLALTRADPNLRLSGVNINNAWAWVDVDTGNAVGYLDIPFDTRAEANQQSEPNLDGQAFDWSRIDFHPDPDSLDAQPKGELHLYSGYDSSGEISTSGNFIGGVPFDGFRVYVAVYDFNPFGLTTGTARTHNKRTFLGAIDIPHTPSLPGGWDTAVSGKPESSGVFFHPPSNTYFLWTGYNPSNPASDSLPEPVFYPQDDYIGILRWKRAFTVEEIVTGTIGVVATNKTVRHKATVYGDFSQRAPGVSITATLRRASTHQEQFVPAGPTHVFVVEAALIDDDSRLFVYEGDVASGTLLVEGVDYSVVFATGTITGITFTTSVIHSVKYNHRANSLLPAHGTLLSASSTTDENGVANFDVAYADDATLEDAIDELTVSD